MDPGKYEIKLSDREKLLSTEPFANGNMVGATAQYFFLTDGLCGEDYFRGLLACEFRPGLFSRYPKTRFENGTAQRIENTSIDDYLSAGCLRGLAVEILDYGRKHLGFFDVKTSGKVNPLSGIFKDFKGTAKQWLWRFPAFRVHLRLAAGEKPGVLDCWIWAMALKLAAKKPFSDQDGWMQSALMVAVYKKAKKNGFSSRICEEAILYWNQRKKLPIYYICSEYIGDKDHYLVQAWEHYEQQN